jgi:hypothetical protein
MLNSRSRIRRPRNTQSWSRQSYALQTALERSLASYWSEWRTMAGSPVPGRATQEKRLMLIEFRPSGAAEIRFTLPKRSWRQLARRLSAPPPISRENRQRGAPEKATARVLVSRKDPSLDSQTFIIVRSLGYAILLLLQMNDSSKSDAICCASAIGIPITMRSGGSRWIRRSNIR